MQEERNQHRQPGQLGLNCLWNPSGFGWLHHYSFSGVDMYFWWSMVTFQPRAEVWVLSQAGPKAFCFCRWQQNRHVISKLLTHKQGWIRGPKLLQPRICIEYPFLSLQSLPLLWEKLKIFSLMVTPGNEVVSVLQLFSEVWDLVMCDFVTCDVLLTPHGCRVCYQPSSRTS